MCGRTKLVFLKRCTTTIYYFVSSFFDAFFAIQQKHQKPIKLGLKNPPGEEHTTF